MKGSFNALVTGATGFIGSHAVEALLRKGYNVTCLVRKTSNLRWLEGLNVRLIYGDCAEKESLKGLIRGFDYIYHLAGITKAVDRDAYFRENSIGTENIIHAASEENRGLKKFIYLSSLSAFGPSPDGKVPDEDDAPHPISDYGRSKLKAEESVLSYKDRFPVVILRAGATYGPRERDIYFFFKLIKKGIMPFWGEGYLSLLYVEDLISGIILAGEKGEGIYFLSDGEIYSVEEVLEEIAKALGVKAMKIKIPTSLLFSIGFILEGLYKISGRPPLLNSDKISEAVQKYWICNSFKAMREIGFRANLSLENGIKKTAEWYRIQGWL